MRGTEEIETILIRNPHKSANAMSLYLLKNLLSRSLAICYCLWCDIFWQSTWQSNRFPTYFSTFIIIDSTWRQGFIGDFCHFYHCNVWRIQRQLNKKSLSPSTIIGKNWYVSLQCLYDILDHLRVSMRRPSPCEHAHTIFL